MTVMHNNILLMRCVFYFEGLKTSTSDTSQTRFTEGVISPADQETHYEVFEEGKDLTSATAKSEPSPKQDSERRPTQNQASQRQSIKTPIASGPTLGAAARHSCRESPTTKSDSQNTDDIYQNISKPEPILASELQGYIHNKKNGEINDLYHEFDVS